MTTELDGLGVDLQAIVDTFLAETSEGLSTMEQTLVELEASPSDAEALQRIFRVAHTLKGNAASLGFKGVADFTHVLEDVLDALRSRALLLTPPLATLLLGTVDLLRRMVPAAVAGEDEPDAEALALLERLRSVRAGGGVGDAGSAARPCPERREAAGRRRDDAARDKTLRVATELLDRMTNLTGEIAIAHGRLRQTLCGTVGQVTPASAAHEEAERLFASLQELVMQARLVPLWPIFRPHVRTVRDAAAAHGKLARLVTEGEDVEVDTTLVEHVRDPLTHLIRNAIDHGIESPAARAAAGKDPIGTITLRAFRDGGSLVLEVADDGAGPDRQKILARARETGLLPDGALPSDADILRLIFEPGFSTADTVSDLSGRGVGLDVVQRNVTSLRGTVAVAGEPGLGTRITLRLPLTLAVIAGLSVGVGGETFVVPLDAVVECLQLSPGDRPHEDGRGVVNLRGQSLPFVSLSRLFGAGAPSSGTERQVVVVKTEEGMAGLAVDAIHGDGQTVVKPLGRMFRGAVGVSGATILGDGRVGLILDVGAIVRREHARPGARAAEPHHPEPA